MVGLGRREVAIVLGLAVAAAVLASRPLPAAPAPVDSDTLVFAGYDADTWVVVRNGEEQLVSAPEVSGDPIAGDFSAAPGTDLFVYGFRSAPDALVHIEPTGTGVTPSVTPQTVNGEYQPLVGDFDANGVDDILWYAWGEPADSIWLFRADGTHRTVAISVRGDYTPFVVEATGDGHDDVVWYGRGTVPDSLWAFGEGGGHTVRSLRIDGDYQPLVGHVRDTPEGSSQEQVVWYDSDGPDSLWTFTATGHVARSLPDVEDAFPVVGDLLGTGRDVVLWYRVGAAVEHLTTFATDGTPSLGSAPSVSGVYTPVVGDLDGNGRQDIAWTTQGRASIWTLDSTGTSYTQTAVRTGHTYSLPAIVRTDPSAL